jgi:hypothetical protein
MWPYAINDDPKHTIHHDVAYNIIKIPITADCLSCSRFIPDGKNLGSGECGRKRSQVSRRSGVFCSDLDFVDNGYPIGEAPQ